MSVFTTVTSLLWETGVPLLTVPQVLRTLLKLNCVVNRCLVLVRLNAFMATALAPPDGHFAWPDPMKHAVTPCNVIDVPVLPLSVPHCLLGLLTVPRLLCRAPHWSTTYRVTLLTPLLLSIVARPRGRLRLVLAVRRVMVRTSELKSAVVSFTCGLVKWPLST